MTEKPVETMPLAEAVPLVNAEIARIVDHETCDEEFCAVKQQMPLARALSALVEAAKRQQAHGSEGHSEAHRFIPAELAPVGPEQGEDSGIRLRLSRRLLARSLEGEARALGARAASYSGEGDGGETPSDSSGRRLSGRVDAGDGAWLQVRRAEV